VASITTNHWLRTDVNFILIFLHQHIMTISCGYVIKYSNTPVIMCKIHVPDERYIVKHGSVCHLICSRFKMWMKNVTSQQKQLRNSCSENGCLRNERQNQKTIKNTNKYSVNFTRFRWGWITKEVLFFETRHPPLCFTYTCIRRKEKMQNPSLNRTLSLCKPATCFGYI
jgi:hypothetical protein